MTSVSVGYGTNNPTHDISLGDGSTTHGYIFKGGTRVLQEIPLSPPAQAFEIEQRNWIGGRGRINYEDDPTGFNDSLSLWSTSEQRLMPMLQWRFANGIRNAETSLPTDNSTMAWWGLYGSSGASQLTRYLAISFVASASYNADKGYLWIRRRGTPGTLTFELCQDNAGAPGTVLQTVTKTVSNITDTVSVYQTFDWTGTQALTSGTTYWVKVYGASSDNSTNHWEVLGNNLGSGKYSIDNSAWSTSNLGLYYRITDADISRRWWFFQLEGGTYAVSQNDDGTTSLIKNNGVRGTASSATTNTLTCASLAMTTNQYTNAYIRIYDGTGDGQIRKIASNTGTQFTVTANWAVTPDTTSRFVIYYTDYWNATTGTPALTSVKGKPAVTSGVAYLPQGQAANMKRMRVNANTHDFADDGTNKADLILYNVEGTAPVVYSANANAATIAAASAVGWGTNLTFGTAKNVGGSEFRITNLASHNKLLHILKENGLYTYSNGIAEQLGSSFSDAPDNNTGLGVGSQNNYLWFGWYHSIERMVGTSIDDMLNFKSGYEGLPSDRTGVVSSIVSGVGWLFFAINGLGSNYSSIICWNGYGFHEIFRSWDTGVRIQDLFWQPNIANRGRLWFSVGGDMAYIEFPLYAANPLKDSTINYQHEGVIVTSTIDAHDQNLYKVLGLLRVFLDSGTVEVDYQTNADVGTNTWTVLGTASTTPVKDLNMNIGQVFKVRFRFRLQVANSRTPTILSGWQIGGRMIQLEKYQFICTFRADSDGESKGDEPDFDPDVLYSQLETWANTQTKLTFRANGKTEDRSGTGRVVTVALPVKSIDALDTEDNKWTGAIQVAILEV